MLGRIHSIETLGALDGPGLRVVVFMQGCRLRCRYCQNPDTWAEDAGKEVSAREIVDMAIRYKPYFRGGGGITLSGGEPLLQPAFATEVLLGCRARGIHTALDTAGVEIDEFVDQALAQTDLVILDIKHADAERHRQLTGAPLEPTLTFMRQVAVRGIDLWVRQVIVPGWNDSERDMLALADLIRGATTLKKVELLPYHAMARAKWEALGKPYPLAGTPEADPAVRKHLEEVLIEAIS